MKSSILSLAIACAKDLALASDNSCADTSCDADVTTLLQGGLRTHSLKLVQTHLHELNTPSATEGPAGRYVGCFVDDGARDLQEGPMQYGYTSVSCNVACREYRFFALQAGGWCVCGNAYSTEDKYAEVVDGQCGSNCAGDDQLCGGMWRNAVYSTVGGGGPEEEWEPEASSPCEEAMEGMGDWTVVRHAPPGNQWHGANDRLGGTSVYGDPAGGAHSQSEWSIAFNVEDVHTFLFATGDCEKWLVASKDAVIGEYYANQPRQIMESSTSEHPYMAAWYNRATAVEDPWISLGDHFASIADGSILYGENHFGHAHAERVLPVHEGANVFVELWSSPCEAAVQGAGGWTLVRHAPPGNQWHGATDRLGGTAVYGDPAGGAHSAAEWSAAFNVDDVSTFMFATGDCEKWLVASKDAVIGEYYANQPRQIMRSSTSEHPYTATWYNREAQVEDPWISLGDHHGSIQDGSILYGENHFGHAHAALVLPVHNGANVFVKL